MNRSSGFIKIAVLVLVVIVVGALIGIMATRKAAEVPPLPPSEAVLAPPKPLVDTSSPPTSNPDRTTAPATQPTVSAPAPVVAAGTNMLADWEDRLDDILGSDAKEKTKAGQLLVLLPKTPPDGQEQVAQHLTNLVEDDDYASLAAYLTNSSFPETVLDVLFQDVLNRPNQVKLPLLLELAKNSEHAKSAEAREMLELFLDENYGTDWAKWQTKMTTWLKDNPD